MADRLATLRTIRVGLAGEPLRSAAQRPNGDERRYSEQSYLGNFSKGLRHDALGLVDPSNYRDFLRCIARGGARDFQAIPSPFVRDLVAALVAPDFSYVGDDLAEVALAPAADLASATTAAEMVELYWLAATRDVPFATYAGDPTIAAACEELSPLAPALSTGAAGAIGPAQIFRGPGASVANGPYLSQFYWSEIRCDPLGGAEAALHFSVSGRDYLTDRDAYLAAQKAPFVAAAERERKPAFHHSMRTLADALGRSSAEAVFANAATLIADFAPDARQPFFDPTALRALAATAQMSAGRAVYWQKFCVHRRVRPEEVAWLVDLAHRGRAMPLHPSLTNARAVAGVQRRNGNALLPQVYPGGCPAHPAYPAAHAGIAGSVVTILKAFTVDDFPFPEPVVANDDGSSLLPYTATRLTLGGELDKLAANFALGRGGAGVHFRSDSVAGLRLGEDVALSVLADALPAFRTFGDELVVRRFDGTLARVRARQA